MAETTKAIGIRIPLTLWTKIQEYGLANHPKGDSFDVTQTLVTLLANALAIPLDDIVKRPTAPDDYVIQLVRQELEQALANIATMDEVTSLGGRLQAIEQRPPMDIGYVLNQLRGMAERIGAIEQTIATVPTRPPTAPQAKEPGELGDEDRKWVRRFEAEPELRAAAAEAIAQGGTSKEIADRLLEADHGPGNGKAFDPSVITRMRKAIAHLESTGG